MLIIGKLKDEKEYVLFTCKYPQVLKQVIFLLNNGNTYKYKTHHLYPLIEFFQFLKEHGFLFELSGAINKFIKSKIKVYIALDLMDKQLEIIKIIKKYSKNCKLVLVAAEHPNYQIINYKSIAKEFDFLFSPYKLIKSASHTFFPYIFQKLPLLKNEDKFNLEKSFILNKINVLDSTLICSNLYTSSNSNYGLRRHLINTMSEIKNLNFKWFGKGWDLSKQNFTNIKFYKYLRSNILQKPRLTKSSVLNYQGELKDKYILQRVKSIFAIENFSYPKLYNSEKFTEPLIYGCIPIYLGAELPHDFKNFLELNINSNFIAKDLTEAIFMALEISQMRLDETKLVSFKMRDIINNFLDNNDYNTNLYSAAKIILNEIN